MSPLDAKWQAYLTNALSSNTKRTYSSAQRLFIDFCSTHGFLHDNGSPCPASELTILRFIGHTGQSRQASTFRVYLAAIRALHVQLGYADPFLNQPRIPLVIKGLRRSQSFHKTKDKLPVTALVLHSIKLQLDLSKADDLMLWAACCTAFLAFYDPQNSLPPIQALILKCIYHWLIFLSPNPICGLPVCVPFLNRSIQKRLYHFVC